MGVYIFFVSACMLAKVSNFPMDCKTLPDPQHRTFATMQECVTAGRQMTGTRDEEGRTVDGVTCRYVAKE